MQSYQQEVIAPKLFEDRHNCMRQFCYLLKTNLLFCCKMCNKILTTNSIIEKILRLKTGTICFIIGDEDENSELMEKFKVSLFIKPELIINENLEFKTVGVNEIYCKNCKNKLGLRIKQTDDTQIFMLNKFILKYDSLKFFCVEELGIKPFHFMFKTETMKNMDKTAFEIEEYIHQSGQYIQKYFDLLTNQSQDFHGAEKFKNDIDKLGDIIKYLNDKNFI